MRKEKKSWRSEIKSWDEWDGPEKERIVNAMNRTKASFARLKNPISAEKIKSFDVPKFKAGICVFGSITCIIIGALFVSTTFKDINEYKNAAIAKEATIVNLKTQLQELSEYEGVTLEIAARDMTAAELCGDMIVDVQNKYLASPPYNFISKGVMTEDKWNEYYDNLYESATNFIASDTGNVGAWYLPPEIYTSETLDTPFYWENNVLFAYAEDRVPMIWTCWQEGNDKLIAYAIGEFDFEDNLVYNIEVYTTAYGQKLYDEINTKLITYDWDDANITDEERQQLIESFEADLELQNKDVDSTVNDILAGLGKVGVSSGD